VRPSLAILGFVLACLVACAALDAERGGLECAEPGRLTCVPGATEEVCQWDKAKKCQVCRCVNLYKEPDAPRRLPAH
jgi:hypothetical protein